MNILQCKLCKKPFQSLGGKICNNCLEKMDENFITVRDYLDEHVGATMDVVSEETGVHKNVIIHMLKEGRLVINDPTGEGGGGGILACELCGKAINTGRLCNNCKSGIASKMEKNIKQREPVKKEPPPQTKTGAKMHTGHKER